MKIDYIGYSLEKVNERIYFYQSEIIKTNPNNEKKINILKSLLNFWQGYKTKNHP